MISYLETEISNEYLELLPSRWSALLQRMARSTQALQKEYDTARNNEDNDRLLDEDFSLADQLLERAHSIYRRGIRLLQEEHPLEEGSTTIAHHMKLLLQSMLDELSMKEMILADWSHSRADIAPDKLRVYCHAMIARQDVRVEDIQRILFLLKKPAGAQS